MPIMFYSHVLLVKNVIEKGINIVSSVFTVSAHCCAEEEAVSGVKPEVGSPLFERAAGGAAEDPLAGR